MLMLESYTVTPCCGARIFSERQRSDSERKLDSGHGPCPCQVIGGRPMVSQSKDVTAAELAIMEQLWKHESAAVKELSQRLYGASTPSDIATVQKLLGAAGRKRLRHP